MLAFCEAVVQEMGNLIRLPDAEEAAQIARRWQHRWAFPQCFRAIDGTHIPIATPEDGSADHINRKGWSSVQLQAVCDDRYM